MNRHAAETLAFAQNIKALGFLVYLAKDGHYGFITDDTGARVLSFSFTDGGSLSGNYGPPSQKSGTGWRLEMTPNDLRTVDDVRRALHAIAPTWCRGGWTYYTSVAQHMELYGDSSGFAAV